MRNAIDYIQVLISMIIMVVLTALTIVSSETATVRPKNPALGEVIHERVYDPAESKAIT